MGTEEETHSFRHRESSHNASTHSILSNKQKPHFPGPNFSYPPPPSLPHVTQMFVCTKD